VSTDGKLAFVSNYGSAAAPGRTISVIDIAARHELHRVNLDPLRRPHGLSFAGGKLYFTAEGSKAIGRYDPAANRVDWVLGTSQETTHMILVSPDLNRIYTANIDGDSISVMERVGQGDIWNAMTIRVGKGPEGMALAPDGRQLWAAHSADGAVSIIDTLSKSVTQTINVQTKRSNRLRFTPDGKHVLITDLDAGDLVVLDAAARRPVKRVKLGRNPEGLLVAPDGSFVYVAVEGENQLAKVELKTFTVIDKISTGVGPDGMAWVKAQ